MTNTVGTIYAGGALSRYFDKIALEALLPNAFLLKSGTQKTLPKGQNKYVFSLVTKATGTVAGLTLSEGVTPTEGAWTMTQVEVTLIQLGEFVKFSDVLLEDSAVELISSATKTLAKNLAAVADLYIQDTIDAGTNVIYGGAATSRVTVAAASTLTATKISQAVANLRNNNAEPFDSGRMMGVSSPMVLHDLRTDNASGNWLDCNKYVTPEKIFNGEVGAIAGARMVESSNIAMYANAGVGSTVDVYPTFIYGKDGFGVVTNGDPKVIYKMPGSAGTSDPLDQQASVGVKMRVGAAILRQAALYRIETSSSIGANV